VRGPLVLAIDLGTGSCRALLFDEEGREVAAAQREWTHPPVPGIAGSQGFDTARNWRLICDCVRQATAAAHTDPGRIRAVSATSMREGMVLYDSKGRELWACPNVDSRAGDEAAELAASGAADEIYRLGGDWVSITAPARFLWLRRHEPELMAGVRHVGMLSDWALRRLSGRFVTDPSAGSSSGMFDLAARSWSESVVELCGLERTALPEVVEPGTRIGGVTEVAAAETGLAPGTPVVVGGADTQLGLVGIGVTEGGRRTIVGGSFWQYTAVLDAPLVDPHARLRTLCHSVPGRWMIEGIGFYSGLALRWYRDAFCSPEVEAARREGIEAYAALEAAAATVEPGSNGVLAILSNLMNARRWIHASPSFVGPGRTAGRSSSPAAPPRASSGPRSSPTSWEGTSACRQ
jgi:autoinducer 2 (AI-2) kinase